MTPSLGAFAHREMRDAGQAVTRAMVKPGVRGSFVTLLSANAVVAIPNRVPCGVFRGGINPLPYVMAVA